MSAVSRLWYPRSGSGNELFRAWGSAISNALRDVGLVPTNDTGQVNWLTAVEPTSLADTYFEVYRFSDALQAIRPVFIKIIYTRNGTVTAYLRLIVSTGTDGAGNMTGLVSNTQGSTIGVAVAGDPAWASSPLLAFRDESSVSFVTTVVTSTSQPYNWATAHFIERSRNPDGTANGDGVSVHQITSTSSSMTQILSFTDQVVSPSDSRFPINTPTRYSSYNDGTSVGLFPAVSVTPRVQAPGMLFIGCALNEFPRMSKQSVIINGDSHEYLALTGSSGARTVAGGTTGLLVRHE